MEGNPGIRIFTAADPSGGLGHIFNQEIAEQQQSALYQTAIGEVFSENGSELLIPASVWQNLTPEGYLPLLFEGVSEGKGELEIIFTTQLPSSIFTSMSSNLFLELKDIKNMYERYEVVVEGTDSFSVLEQDSINSIGTDQITTSYQRIGDFAYPEPQKDEERDYILFVHGWRMQYWEKLVFAETSYKRLFWQNYKGRFGAFVWPTEWTPRREFKGHP